MNLLEAKFQHAKQTHRKLFIPFLSAGDPDLEFTQQILLSGSDVGADIWEIGFPFSDPVADGPIIQSSYTRALKKNLRIHDILTMLKQLPGNHPRVGMVSYSMIFKMGHDVFIQRAKEAGLSGVVVPDLPFEEAVDFTQRARVHDFACILLVSLTTRPQRMEQIVQLCSGFVYIVGVVGITGKQQSVTEEVVALVNRIRPLTPLPLCVGFGISSAEHVRQLRDHVDGIIVGSALVAELEHATQDRDRAGRQILEKIRTLAQACNPES